MNKITQTELKEKLNYDPDTGIFTWINTIHKERLNKKAGSISSDKLGKRYIKIHVGGKRYLAHHLASLYMTGEFPETVMDHIDGDGINNKWENLRCVTSSDNSKNRKIRLDNTSGVCGVCWHKGNKRWRVQISLMECGKSKRVFVGEFKNIDDAILARKQAEKLHGYHKNHGIDRRKNV